MQMSRILYLYAFFMEMSYLRESLKSLIGFMRTLKPGIANMRPSMRKGTSE